MRRWVEHIARAGTTHRNTQAQNRDIILTNSIALFIIAVDILLTIIHFSSHQAEKNIFIFIAAGVIQGFVPYLNKKRHTILSRSVLISSIILSILISTLIRKTEVAYESTFYIARSAILISSLLFPLAIFHFRERAPLIANLAFGFIITFLYDPIHNFFGVGYYQMGFNDADYYYNNFLYFIIYMFTGGILGYLKYITERYELKYEKLIKNLDAKNGQIENQKEELEASNYVMEKLLTEKDQNLVKINQELVNQNLDLLQFSHTVSHNLRGPVARMLGLMNLLKKDPQKSEMESIREYLFNSVYEMDVIIKDLNKILNVRQDSFQLKERVYFEEAFFTVRKFLSTTCDTKVNLYSNFDVPYVYSVRSYIHSILEHLVVNAIQFRAPDRIPEITIRTSDTSKATLLEVIDNGLGINLKNHKNEIFKPFKTFHPIASGKGLNLYLIKLQVEKLGGYITVESVPDKGSWFKVYLNK